MQPILAIDTALDVCSVAIGYGDEILALEEMQGANLHAANLGLLMEKALKTAGIKPADLSAVSVNKGPGSYTGLRIGVSAAKGLAYSHNLPLYSESCTRLLANNALQALGGDNLLYCPLIDARRMEVYYAVYDHELNDMQPIEAAILTEEFLADLLTKQLIAFFGNGMAKAKTILSRQSNAIYIENINPSAKWQLPLIAKKMGMNQTENIFTFEPYYVKDFMAKDPNGRINKVLRRD
jgi:tRNA threonylcarbamoyladenosine biosynthesis protein TsaB